MLDNHVYDLMMQMVAENKSLWRIRNNYMKDSNCKSCEEFWTKLEAQKEGNVKELEMMIKDHIA